MPTQNVQRVLAAIAPAKGQSPIAKVKRDRIVLTASLQASVKKRMHQIFSLEADGLHDQEACWRQICVCVCFWPLVMNGLL
jgi:hypothetical protein